MKRYLLEVIPVTSYTFILQNHQHSEISYPMIGVLEGGSSTDRGSEFQVTTELYASSTFDSTSIVGKSSKKTHFLT
jgi:hypothetical protein